VALMTTFQGLGTGYHRDLQQDKQIIFASVDGTIACLKMIALGLDHLDLLGDRCVEALERGDAIATDLTEHLVSLGVPFRVAYRQIGALVAEQRSKGMRLVDLTTTDLETSKLPLSLLEQLDVRASANKRAARYPSR
jgi:argininosuccinate lyase